VVRDDVVDPFVDIVELEDGSVVLDDEKNWIYSSNTR